jgi:formylglycine-generating enzyme required for sulfatase activity
MVLPWKRIPLALTLTVLWCGPAGLVRAQSSPPEERTALEARGEPAPSPHPAGGSAVLSLEVLPRVVYCGELVRARVALRDPAKGLTAGERTRGELPREHLPEAAKVHWEASGGNLFSDDLPEVEWRAPRAEGRTTLRVEVVLPDRSLQGEAQVEVKAPSTEDMIWIPAGSFTRGDIRGTNDTKETKTLENLADEPYHTVYLDGFWIDRHQVTNEKYRTFLEECLEEGLARVEPIAVMGKFERSWVPFYYLQPYDRLYPETTRYKRKPPFAHDLSYDGSRFHIKPGKERCPAVDVSWLGATAYLRYYGKSLPSEAQWEKAARGSDGRRFPWGNNVPTAYHLNVNSYLAGQLSPVGTYSPLGDSPYGVADMVSGAFEWMGDWFNAAYYPDSLSPEVPVRNPAGPFWGTAHSIRGFPAILQNPKASLETDEPLTFRYSWRFEFLMGDTFASAQTAFRGVISQVPAHGK